MDYSKNVLGCASCNCNGHLVLPSEGRQKRDKMTIFLVRHLDLTFGEATGSLQK
jgi:hypothetical protein